jgi:hypothetical protein
MDLMTLNTKVRKKDTYVWGISLKGRWNKCERRCERSLREVVARGDLDGLDGLAV